MSETIINDCWNRIGVQGDKSCAELKRHIHCRNCSNFEAGAEVLLSRPAPPGYIEEWTRLIAAAKEAEAGHTDAALVFRIGAEWLAVDAGLCMEIVSMRTVRRVPHSSDRMLMGLVSVRGELILCFSLAALLGIEEPADKDDRALPRLLILKKERLKLAVRADEVAGLHKYRGDAVRPVPATVSHAVPRFSRGMLADEGRNIGLLDDELVFHALRQALA